MEVTIFKIDRQIVPELKEVEVLFSNINPVEKMKNLRETFFRDTYYATHTVSLSKHYIMWNITFKNAAVNWQDPFSKFSYFPERWKNQKPAKMMQRGPLWPF